MPSPNQFKAIPIAICMWIGLAGCSLGQEPVLAVGNTVDRSIYLISLDSGEICRTISAERAISGLAADQLNQTFYYTDLGRLYSVPFAGGASTLIGSFSGDINTIFGLGFHQSKNQLYGCINEGIFLIDTTNAQTTLVFDPPGNNLLSGIDIDPKTGQMYVADDDGSAVNGPGIYEIDLDQSNYQPIATPFPSGLNDVDGVATTDGLIYSIQDGENQTDVVQELDLNTGLVSRTFSTPFIAGSFNSAGTIAMVDDYKLPTAGRQVAELELFDEAMFDVMKLNDISAGMLSVSHNGVPVYHRSFGWSDAERRRPLQLNSMMRLGSITKAITAAATRTLIADGHFELTDFVFDNGSNSGLLQMTPFGTPDPRLYQITVEQLLQFKGGWDSSITGDYTFNELTIANEMGIPSPPGRLATIEWIMGRPLQFTPGTATVYSNISYLLLGVIVEQAAQQPLINFVRERVFGPIGVLDCQVIAGRTFPSDQDVREPWYSHFGFTADNVFFPDSSNEPVVPTPYGSWDHEARIGHGGIVADPLAILEFIDHFTVIGDDIGTAVGPNENWVLFGTLSGTNTVARQRNDGIRYVVLFNKRAQSFNATAYQQQIQTQLDQIIDTGELAWPTENITADLLGDLNCDGLFNLLDISPFVDLLSSDRFSPRADFNFDGQVNLLDIGGFVDGLGGG